MSPELMNLKFLICNLKLFTMKTIGLALLMILALLTTVESQISKQPAELVYPHLDAANSRWFFFTAATRPFGMVNLSPDMGVDGAWSSGYRYNRDTINF